jgi:hypothetical protein
MASVIYALSFPTQKLNVQWVRKQASQREIDNITLMTHTSLSCRNSGYQSKLFSYLWKYHP